MTKAQLRRLSDTRFIDEAWKDGLRPSPVAQWPRPPMRCPLPRCGGTWVRDLTATKEKYLCDGCGTVWVRALDLPRFHRPTERS